MGRQRMYPRCILRRVRCLFNDGFLQVSLDFCAGGLRLVLRTYAQGDLALLPSKAVASAESVVGSLGQSESHDMSIEPGSALAARRSPQFDALPLQTVCFSPQLVGSEL